MSSFFFLCLFLPLSPLSPLVSVLPFMVFLPHLCISFHPVLSPRFPHLLPPSLSLPSSSCPLPTHSSLSAGLRGGSFTFIMSRINLRIREQLFSSLLRQDLGFFQETKTGGAWSPGLGFPWMPCRSVTPHHSASPVACTHGARAWSCFSLFWAGVARQPPLVSPKVRKAVQRRGRARGAVRRESLGVLITHGLLTCSILPRGAEFKA